MEESLDLELKFQKELEFVQALANAEYCHFLAQKGYFDDEAFIAYLDYLQYWRTEDYVKFIRYPFALKMLEMLQNDLFRKQMKSSEYADMVQSQLFLHWQNDRANRLADLERERALEADNAQHTDATNADESTRNEKEPASTE